MRIADYFRNPITTYATVGGIYHDHVTVVADYQPEDHKAGIGEYVEVCSVTVGGMDVTDSMLVTEIEELEERLLIEAQDYKTAPHFFMGRKHA